MRTFLATLKRCFNRAFYAVCWFLSRVAALCFLDVRAYGRERVPSRGACLLAANHQSFLDPWVLGLSLRRRCFYLARDSLFRLPILGSMLWRLNVVPVPRGSVASRRSLEEAIKVLRAGELMLMFPEGTRSPDGRLQRLKRGVAMVARATLAPVLPVLIVGTYQVWPRQRKLPRLGWGGLARFRRRGQKDPAGIRIFFGGLLRFEEGESLEAFSCRLREEYRNLAREVGVQEFCAPRLAGDGLDSGGLDSEAIAESTRHSERQADSGLTALNGLTGGNDGRPGGEGKGSSLEPGQEENQEQNTENSKEESAAGTLPCFQGGRAPPCG